MAFNDLLTHWIRPGRVSLSVALSLAALTFGGSVLSPASAAALSTQSAQECLGRIRQSRGAFRAMASEIPRFYGRGAVRNKQHVIMIDYTKHQTKQRLFVVDLATCKIIHRSRIIHGGAWYIYKAKQPDPSWAFSRAKQKYYRRINLNRTPGMLTTCRNSVKGGSTHMTRPGWMYTGACHPNANEGWVRVKTQTCSGYGIQVKPLEGQALGGVTFHDHVRLSYGRHVGQGSLGFQTGGTQSLIDAIRDSGNVNITRGNLVYVHAPQCG
ncbi:MAG: murein L,D-transpeptidase catalytic domain-containing protein [Pseudomonadota bacterium]